MTAPALEARNISAGYGAVPVLRGLDLHVNRGEIVAILGPNGAGKTTALLTLAGELKPVKGSLLANGKVTTAPLHTRARQGLRFVTEERSVFPSLSVSENLRLGGGSKDVALDLFPELRSLLRRSARLLSGGEQQMLALARVLSAQPQLLLADELSLGLAPMVVDRLLAAVQRAAREAGTAVVLVEQQVRRALMTADRGYVFRRGQVVLSGAASDLLSRIEEIEDSYLSGTERKSSLEPDRSS